MQKDVLPPFSFQKVGRGCPHPAAAIRPRPRLDRDILALPFRLRPFVGGFFLSLTAITARAAEVGVSTPHDLSSAALSGADPSMLRVLGALALVLALFLGCVWVFRNWQRLRVQRGNGPRLNVFEARSLGGRQAIYVIGYEQERFLLGATPAGINLISHLPQAAAAEAQAITVAASNGRRRGATIGLSFPQTLAQVLRGK